MDSAGLSATFVECPAGRSVIFGSCGSSAGAGALAAPLPKLGLAKDVFTSEVRAETGVAAGFTEAMDADAVGAGLDSCASKPGALSLCAAGFMLAAAAAGQACVVAGFAVVVTGRGGSGEFAGGAAAGFGAAGLAAGTGFGAAGFAATGAAGAGGAGTGMA